MKLFRPLALGMAVWLTGSVAHADTLSDIYELALKNDARLKAAEATYRANVETEAQARSRLLPQIGGEASYSWTDGEQSSTSLDVQTTPPAPRRQTIDTDIETKAWGISLSQQLFDLPAWFSFQSGKQFSKQAEAQFAYDQQDLITRVADAYFNVLRAGDNLQASKAEELAVKRQLEQTQQRFDVGLIAITDVHEARAAYDAIVAERLTDEGNLATAYEALTTLTGQSHANLWLLDRNFPVIDPDPIDRAQWVEFALQNNYALQAARYAAEASRQNATARRMEHAPKITGSLSYQDSENSGDQDITVRPFGEFSLPGDGDSTTKAAMVKLTVPIFTGGYVSSQRRQAAEQYNATLQQRIDTERTVIQNTRARHIAATTDVQRVKARSQAIVSAQSALDATQAGYEVGTRNIVDVLQAQRVLFASRRDYANARHDYVLDMLRLKQQAGTLSPQDIHDLNQWLIAPPPETALNN
jgi:outer membrane protein